MPPKGRTLPRLRTLAGMGYEIKKKVVHTTHEKDFVVPLAGKVLRSRNIRTDSFGNDVENHRVYRVMWSESTHKWMVRPTEQEAADTLVVQRSS